MKESQIQDGFRRWLDGPAARLGVFYVNPAFGKKSTIRNDWPDFTLFYLDRFFLIESKTAKGALSSGQKKLHAELRSVGIRVEVCRSVEEHVKTALEWLSAVASLANAKDAPAAALSGETGSFHSSHAFDFPVVLSDRMPKDKIAFVNVPADLPDDLTPGVSLALAEEVEPKGTLKRVVDMCEAGFSPARRIGMWNNVPWLIRTDSNPETFIRKATPEDLSRYSKK